MAYILKGREVKTEKGKKSPCIFCGRYIEHVNEGGTACFVNAFFEGKARTYAYCNEDRCPQIEADSDYERSMWRCGCVSDYIENIGETCVNCKRIRDDAIAPSDYGGHKVHVYTLKLIAERPLTDREIDRLEESSGGLAVRSTLIVRHDTRTAEPAEFYEKEFWFEE